MAQQSLDAVVSQIGGFGRYQVQLLFTTELSYLICTGSLLSAKYLATPAKGICLLDRGNGSNNETKYVDEETLELLQRNGTSEFSDDLCTCPDSNLVLATEGVAFYSLFMQLDVRCNAAGWQLGLNMAAMVGGVVGAVVFGFLGDRFGRKRMCMVALTGVILSDLALAASSHLGYALFVMALIGMACGGVMTGNLAFLMECVGPKYRLLCAALNGWPCGIMVMALTGYLTGYWRHYILATACLGLPFWVGFFFVHESPRWLVQQNRYQEASSTFRKIAIRNGRSVPEDLEETLRKGRQDVEDLPARKYGYLDLSKDRTVLVNLLALFYSWFAAAIISFGIYFTMGALSGNVFLNFFLLGLFKGSTGIIPYFLSNPPFRVGRKPILCFFVTVACVCVWSCIISFYAQSHTAGSQIPVHLTVLTVLGGAAIDPIWKVNHLYSAELFPTVVRSMARGLLNVGSRVGSAFSPLLLYLSEIYFVAPYWIYGILALFHVLVSFFFLPETKGRPLPEALNEKAPRQKGEGEKNGVLLPSQPFDKNENERGSDDVVGFEMKELAGGENNVA